MPENAKNFVFTVSPEQAQKLHDILEEREWTFAPLPYARFKASGVKVNVVAYQSGKLTVQGANAADFVEFVLEPEIIGAQITAPDGSAEAPQPVTPHGGVDESGKGDFFGPLVIAGVYADAATAPKLLRLGVRDSKTIRSDEAIFRAAQGIRDVTQGRFSVVAIGNETYNKLYRKIGNLNRLLAWGHARVIENLLEKVPECPRMLSDQFTQAPLIQRALLEKGKSIKLEQRPRAESDIAVAAASILARERFVLAMRKLAQEAEINLPKGVNPAVEAAGRAIVEKFGPDALERFAKTHFRTRNIILGLPVEDPPDRARFHRPHAAAGD